jgi:hypothetical protein
MMTPIFAEFRGTNLTKLMPTKRVPFICSVEYRFARSLLPICWNEQMPLLAHSGRTNRADGCLLSAESGQALVSILVSCLTCLLNFKRPWTNGC